MGCLLKNYRLDTRRKGSKYVIYIQDYGIGHGKEMETVLEEMTAWCTESNIGWRMAWDQFYFKNQKEVDMFILRWS